jgi:uncharacterized iron-regulated membrane protein
MSAPGNDSAGPQAGAFYAAIWRWHFIAGLIVLPVLTLLAVTGGLYLFKPELDHLIYRRMEDVPARTQPFASADRIVERVQATTGGKVLQFTPAEQPDRAVRLLVRGRDGKALTAFADPYDGHVTGVIPYGGVMQLIRKLHSLQKFGFWASTVVETAAGWAIVMVLTGLYLWWPRGRKGGVVTVRGEPRRRVFWRDLHAVAGAFSAGVILFLAVTGMPWSMVWGDHVQAWVTAANLSEPKAPAKVMPAWMLSMDMPARPTPQSAKPDRPWALEKAPVPMSAMPGMSGMEMGKPTLSVAAAVARFDRLGLHRPYSVALPDGPEGAFVADYRPDRIQDSRTVYLDQYTGRVLADVGFKDWGVGAKAIEWGISVHQGQQYGAVNRYVMLAGCLALVLLAVSAEVMWWKRRPRGRLGVPPAPPTRGAYLGVLAIVLPLAALFPLVGATLIIALGLEFGLRQLRRAPT